MKVLTSTLFFVFLVLAVAGLVGGRSGGEMFLGFVFTFLAVFTLIPMALVFRR